MKNTFNKVKRTALSFLMMVGFQTTILGQTDTISVSFTKSAYLLFDNAAKYDFGSEDIIVRQSGNKLIIQSAVENFEETNLFVQVGTDIYIFIVKYEENPAKYIYNFQKNQDDQSGSIDKKSTSVDYTTINAEKAKKEQALKIEEQVTPGAKKVLNSKKIDFNNGAIQYGCLIYTPLMYVDDTYMYVKLIVENPTNIPFDVDYLSYNQRILKGFVKNKAVQDIPILSAFEYKRFERIEPKNNYEMVVVFPKFTIDKDKVFILDVWEKGGDRKIRLEISSKHFLKAKQLNTI